MKELYLDLQKRLQADLELGKNVHHPTTKGDATEIDWLRMLDEHLPKRYHAKKAFVVDADGNLSDQIDIVIFDRHYCPLLFEHSGAIYVPAESVYAGFEVKQTINKKFIDYSGEKIASIRRLRRTSTHIPYAEGLYPPKKPFKILGGILSLKKQLEPSFWPIVRGSNNQLARILIAWIWVALSEMDHSTLIIRMGILRNLKSLIKILLLCFFFYTFYNDYRRLELFRQSTCMNIQRTFRDC